MKYIFIAFLLLLLMVAPALAQYTPAPENLKAREWFQDARFGMFIHWGVYSVLGHGEWVMNNEKIPIPEYEKLPARFDPEKFDAAQWVALAKAAGMRYITITSKHHDGFAMFGTKQTKWNIVDATPWHRDPLKELAEECRRQGIKLFFYYSELDWHHPDYRYEEGSTGKTTGRTGGGDWQRYLDFMNAQLRELLTDYGPIGGIWFDGYWDNRKADWQLEKRYALIHSLQPAALIGSNHHERPHPGEDFQMFERDLPGETTADWNKNPVISDLPLETCDTINGAWGYDSRDRNFKSPKQLIHYFVRAAGHNANFLLNIGPRPDGTIQPEFVERLRAIGEWTSKYGETIYGTRGGPLPPRNWGVMTRKGDKIFVHVLDWPDEALAIPDVAGVKSATLFGSGKKVEISRVNGAMLLRLPKEIRDDVDTIVVLEKK
jgi:alpha-L-fucosidase